MWDQLQGERIRCIYWRRLWIENFFKTAVKGVTNDVTEEELLEWQLKKLRMAKITVAWVVRFLELLTTIEHSVRITIDINSVDHATVIVVSSNYDWINM